MISSEYGWTDDQILDLPLSRLIQVRSVIFGRQKEESLSRLRVEETVARFLAGAVHGSAGNKSGMKASQQFRLTPKEPVVASANLIKRRFPVDPALGLFTPEQIAAARDKILAEREQDGRGNSDI